MYSTDFNALAARMAAGLQDVRVCLLLSSDGLTLGAFPESSEEKGREVWDAVQQVGDPHRGFLDLGEEIWVMARRGAYAAIIVTAPTVRPGLLLDKLDFMLRQAEEARLRVEVETGTPVAKPETPRRPRSPLHRGEPARPEPRKAPAGARPDPRSAETEEPAYAPPEELTAAAERVVDVSMPDQRNTIQVSGAVAPVLDPPTVPPMEAPSPAPETPPVEPPTPPPPPPAPVPPPVAPDVPAPLPEPEPEPEPKPVPQDPEPEVEPRPASEPEPEPRPAPEPDPEPETTPQDQESEPTAAASVAGPEIDEAELETTTGEAGEEELADPVAELSALAAQAAAAEPSDEDGVQTSDTEEPSLQAETAVPVTEPAAVEPPRPEMEPVLPPDPEERTDPVGEENGDRPSGLKEPGDGDEERGSGEVDRVALAREFGKLFSDGGS
jgi:hypothetical protein